MAGYAETTQTDRDAVQPRWLAENRQDFCLMDMSQESFSPEGKPQWTLTILYVHEGAAYEKSFTMTCNEVRDKIFGRMLKRGLPFHHMCLVQHTSKSGQKYYDLADSIGEDGEPLPADGKCACNNYGVIDPEKPETWTEHYRLSFTLNTELTRRGQELMNTSQMSVGVLRTMLTAMGVTYEM